MNKFLWILVSVAALLYLLRKPLSRAYLERVSGLEAVQDAATRNGYTTYNTQLYTAPIWQPFLQFFKAGSYNPGSKGPQPETVDYSVQA